MWCIIRFAFISNTRGKYFPFLILIYTIKQASGANMKRVFSFMGRPPTNLCRYIYAQNAVFLWDLRRFFFFYSSHIFFATYSSFNAVCKAFVDIITFIAKGFHIFLFVILKLRLHTHTSTHTHYHDLFCIKNNYYFFLCTSYYFSIKKKSRKARQRQSELHWRNIQLA